MISRILSKLKKSSKALPIGAALFLVIAALGAKSVVIKGISHQIQANPGILGGPVAFAAPKPTADQPSLEAVLGAEDPAAIAPPKSADAPNPQLSTGSLDGAGSLKKDVVIASNDEPGSDPSLVQSNQKLIKAATVLAKDVPKSSPLAHYFIQPTSGYNWGVLHNYNAVDIANSCGTPVLAAAAGTVVDDPNLGSGDSGWNGGYGDFILIEHPNGVKTRYAHLSKIEVAVGDQVEQGQEIGEIGNTGHVQGETGCHLHFEVIGAPNPFAHS